MENKIDINQTSTNKGVLNLDLSDSLSGQDSFTFMRNGVVYAQDGEFIFAQTEQSNRLVCTLPYPVIGNVKLPDGTWCLFLTDDFDSEIGIFNEVTFQYTTKLNAKWLNFNRANLIFAAAKQNADGTFSIYWADGRRNPDRILNLSKIKQATYDSIRQAKLITPPFLNLKQSSGGTLPDGSYQVVMSYSQNQVSFTDYYSLTLPVAVFTEGRSTGALDVAISSLDNDYDYFDLILIQTAAETTTAKRIGTYPRATSNIHISSFNRPEYITVPLEKIVLSNIPWVASDQISSNNQYLFRVGTQTLAQPNYQLQAFDIIPEYVVHQYPENYYEYGNDVGHFRNEVYSYYIQLLHKIGGYWSDAFALSGREAEDQDLVLASGSDVYEATVKECNPQEKIPHWQIYNTAGDMVPLQIDEDLVCEGQEVGYGQMAYWESTEKYPDNPTQFGIYANTNIRLPKFPDEAKVPRYSIRSGKKYINVLAIRFKNIPHPKKADGSLDTDWVGYRIIRQDRRGNKSIISRGMLTNVRSYKEVQGNTKVDVYYANYPINDLSSDTFISQTQTANKNNTEKNFAPLTDVHYDKFNYYSPATTFDRQGLGEEMVIETEEIADVDGSFSEVYSHPKGRLLSLFSFWLAAALGAVEALLTVTGKSIFTAESKVDIGLTGGVSNSFYEETRVRSVEDIIGLNPIKLIAEAIKAGSGLSAINVIKNLGLAIASIGLKVLTFTFWGIQYADRIIDVIEKFLGFRNYTLQYNCHADFNRYIPVLQGWKRRYVTKYQYLENGIQTINGKTFNNFGKHNSVYVELNHPLAHYNTNDNSRQTLSQFGICDDIFKKTVSTGVAYYATSQRKNVNQYGRVESAANFLITHNNYFSAIPQDNLTTYTTPSIFGGDCYIVKQTVQTKHLFFTQDLSYPLGAKDGEEYDYNLYRNIGYPRFWANFFKYDFSEFISRDVVNFTKFARTTTNRHNLDCKGHDKENKFRVDDAYFYTSNNGVLDFFVESDFNISFREKPQNNTYFYSNKFSSLQEIFRSDRLRLPEEFRINKNLSHQANQIYAQQQAIDYDPAIYDSVYKYSRNRLIYSLPSYLEQKYDNWQRFLTLNQYDFPTSEFGNFISLHRVDGERILFLFDRSSPYITLGRNQLQLKDGTEIEIGSGGLFAQPPRELMYTEQHYGNSQSRFATLSTPFGTFYPSERQGRLLKFNNSLDEVTRNGLHTWSKMYFPLQLTQLFPDYVHPDNPVIGVGYLSSFDATTDTIYVSKKDYAPIPDYRKDITYDSSINQFYYKDTRIEMTNKDYFDDLSFTLSYSPTVNGFISFHDWHPDWVIGSEKHFFTIKDNNIWLHNDDCQSYCNFYGVQYPWEVEFTQSNKFKVNTLSSVEYYLECYKYKEDCKNKVHLMNENFSHAIIRNSEQISGLVTLFPSTGNPYSDTLYPRANHLGFDTIYSKVENKYRIDQFFDITDNRMSDIHLFHNKPNGYEGVINPKAIDPFKSVYELKLFRHYDNKIRLMKDKPTSKMILKLLLGKNVASPR